MEGQINKSPLNYKPNSGNITRQFAYPKAPTTNDFRQFNVGDEWLDTNTNEWWKMYQKTATSGGWVGIGGVGSIEVFTGNSGGAVGPDISENIHLLGSDGLTVAGNPATHTLTIETTTGNQILTDIIGDSGGAVSPSAGNTITITGNPDLDFVGNPGANSFQVNDLTKTTPFVVNPTVGQSNYQTIAAALAAAGAAGSHQLVYVTAGIYAENVTIPADVHLYGPAAVLQGAVIINDGCTFEFHQLEVAPGAIGVLKSAGADRSYIKVERTICTGNGIGFVCTSGDMDVKFVFLSIENGFGIGDNTSAINEMHLNGRDLEITGTGTGVARANAGNTKGFIDKIANSGAGTGRAIWNISGTMALTVDEIITTTGVDVDAGTVDIQVGNITATTAYDVANGATLNIHCANLSGTETVGATGIRRKVSANSGIITPTYVHIGSGTVTTNNELDIVDGKNFPVNALIKNTNVAAGASANLELNTAAGGGDPYFYLNVDATLDYALGIDNSDSDKLKLTDGASPSAGNEIITVDPTAGNAISFNGAYTFPIADGSNLDYLGTDGAGNLSFLTPLFGKMRQEVYTDLKTLQNCATNIPYDNTIPQQTEGDQILSASITPEDAANELYVFVSVTGTTTNSGTVALFRDAGADAIASSNLSSAIGSTTNIIYRVTAGGVAATTFKVRAGDSAANFYVNGDAGGTQLYGGVANTSMTIYEVSPTALPGPPVEIETLTGDAGGSVGPDGSANINILGNTGAFANGIQFTGTPASNTMTAKALRTITEYVVDATAGMTEYTTIQSALDAANAAGGNATVYVRHGTFIENLTLYTTVFLRGESSLGTTITGVHTPPAGGSVLLEDLILTSATSIFSSAAAGTTKLTVKNCELKVANGYVFALANWTGALVIEQCYTTGTTDGVSSNTAGAPLTILDSEVGAGTANAMQVSGTCEITHSEIDCPIDFIGAGTTKMLFCNLTQKITTAATHGVTFQKNIITKDGVAPITHDSATAMIIRDSIIDSNNNPVIAGTGTIAINNIDFVDGKNIAGTITISYDTALEANVGYFNNLSFNRGGTTVSADGQLIIGNTGSNPSISTLTAGTGVSIVNGSGTITINSSGGGFTWNVEGAAGPTAMSIHNGYITTGAAPTQVVLTLPAVASVGDSVKVCGNGTGLWRVAQGAGQQIHISSSSSTVGAGGYIEATQTHDCITLLCTVANNEFTALDLVGNITLI